MAQKEGQRLILMDETTIEDGKCGYADGRLWCWLIGYTMQQAAGIFLDPAKTGKAYIHAAQHQKFYISGSYEA